MSTPSNPKQPHEDPIRHHTFDGIQEYDKRLPNWWLLTFYATIAFSVVYWFYYSHSSLVPSDQAQVEDQIARIKEAKLASGATVLDDDMLWTMSRDGKVVAAGEATFKGTCMSCHGEALGGGIGPNLVDQLWLYGGRPTDILGTVSNGTAKGMPPWGPVLGTKKISEVVAFILSKHQPSEPGMSAAAPAHAAAP